MKRQFTALGICTAAICTAALVAAGGCAAGGGKLAHNLPPSQRLLEPGPGVGGPGPGVIPPGGAGIRMGPGGSYGMGGGACMPCAFNDGAAANFNADRGLRNDGNIMQAQCMMGPACGPGAGGATSQIAFLGVEGGEVAWDVSGPGMFDSQPLVMPGRQNFNQGAIYRLKLTNLPERPGIELYPTIEVAPVTPRTDAYLAHAPIPIQFTDEDLDQVLSGNYVTKVIYLPDPEFQELALAGVETLVSTRLQPGVDPIAEADRRGSILAILRIGNLHLDTPRQMGRMVQPAQYVEGAVPYENLSSPVPGEMMPNGQIMGPVDRGVDYGGGYGCPDGGCQPGMAPMGPQGMPTAGFMPQPTPPHMVSGVNGPQYGMPYVGTPIGLPGPPHIPLGHQAGLVNHTVKNRTKVLMPPPVHKMKVTVKQRPGMSYPRPVNNVRIDETNRAGFRMRGGTVAPVVPTALKKLRAKVASIGADKCQSCNGEGCQFCQ